MVLLNQSSLREVVHQTYTVIAANSSHLSQELICVEVEDLFLLLELVTVLGQDVGKRNVFVSEQFLFPADQLNLVPSEFPLVYILGLPKLLFLFIQSFLLLLEALQLALPEFKQIAQGLVFLTVVAHSLLPVDFDHFARVLQRLRLDQEYFAQLLEELRLRWHTYLFVQLPDGVQMLGQLVELLTQLQRFLVDQLAALGRELRPFFVFLDHVGNSLRELL